MYSLCFKPILSAGLLVHSHLSGGLQLRNYLAVAGNHKFGFCVFLWRVFKQRAIKTCTLNYGFVINTSNLCVCEQLIGLVPEWS